jgi:hypothetical protein
MLGNSATTSATIIVDANGATRHAVAPVGSFDNRCGDLDGIDAMARRF